MLIKAEFATANILINGKIWSTGRSGAPAVTTFSRGASPVPSSPAGTSAIAEEADEDHDQQAAQLHQRQDDVEVHALRNSAQVDHCDQGHETYGQDGREAGTGFQWAAAHPVLAYDGDHRFEVRREGPRSRRSRCDAGAHGAVW